MANFYGGVTSAEAEAFLYAEEEEARMQASPGTITRLPSQATHGNTFGSRTARQWRQREREWKLQLQQRRERQALHAEAMREAFGPHWPDLPPGAADDPSLL